MIQLRTARTAKQPRRRQAGLSMVELLVAMLVLAVGMMGSMILVRTAIVNNNRNKMDTTATALAQMVLEQINSRSATNATNITINDCTGVARTINPNGLPGPAGAGALLIQGGFNSGNIDFSQDFTVPLANNYAMQYVTCGPAPGTPGAAAGGQVTYEVRWNVTTMTGFTKLVTVSARKRIATNTSALPFFSVPVTLRGIGGQ
jgi:prepilin-type N-terminal cleavage/methylation domain-containing protein